MNSDEPLDLASGRFVNESAIRDHALACSKQFRAGKFTRVGEDFINEVKADIEAAVRAVRNQCRTSPHEPLALDENTCFVTGALSDRVMLEWNLMISRIIQQKVQRQPTVGVTLSRTR